MNDGTKPQPITWTTVLGRIALPVVVALGGYALVSQSLIGPYIRQASDAGRVIGVYQGYDRIAARQDQQRDLVLFWGSSMIREAVDCDLLESAAPRLASYNLSVSGDLPSRRMVELARAQAVHPDCVVIGVSYPEVFETRSPYEDQIGLLPARAYESMSPAARALLPERSRKIAQRNDWERFWWQRKFLFSAVCWKIGLPDRSNSIPDGYVENLKAPFVYRKSIRSGELERFLDQRGGVYPPYTGGGESDPAQSGTAKSLALLVRELARQRTQVVLVNMPLHPLLNAAVPAPRRALLQKFLHSLRSPNVIVLDYQERMAPGDFTDLVHLNAAGRAAFTREMARHLGSSTFHVASDLSLHELQ